MSKTIEPMFFIEHLHLMYNKPNLLKMSKESSFEEAFRQKKNILTDNSITSEEFDIQIMLDKLKILFEIKKGGGLSLESLKKKIRDKVSKIKPRLC